MHVADSATPSAACRPTARARGSVELGRGRHDVVAAVARGYSSGPDTVPSDHTARLHARQRGVAVGRAVRVPRPHRPSRERRHAVSRRFRRVRRRGSRRNQIEFWRFELDGGCAGGSTSTSSCTLPESRSGMPVPLQRINKTRGQSARDGAGPSRSRGRRPGRGFRSHHAPRSRRLQRSALRGVRVSDDGRRHAFSKPNSCSKPKASAPLL